MTKYLFLEYPKCSTCQKARQWLEQHQIEFTARHIVENLAKAKRTAVQTLCQHLGTALQINEFERKTANPERR